MAEQVSGDNMLDDDSVFFRKTIRHFAEMRNIGPEASEASSPFPNDWFDIPEAAMADFGAMSYLCGLTRHHRDNPLSHLLHHIEPAWRLNQYRMFKTNGYARAFITWAGLSPQAEKRFAVDHLPLAPEDWNSGASVWLIDFIAPFGHIDQIIPLLTHNPDLTRVRTLWHNKAGTRYRIVEWSRPAGTQIVSVNSYGVNQFARLLAEGM